MCRDERFSLLAVRGGGSVGATHLRGWKIIGCAESSREEEQRRQHEVHRCLGWPVAVSLGVASSLFVGVAFR